MKILISLFVFVISIDVYSHEGHTHERYSKEQIIQIALGQKELDLEDAMIVRSMKDVNQAERLLMVKRKKRQKEQQEIAMQNSQMQSQQAQEAAQAASQAKQQEMQIEAQLEAQKTTRFDDVRYYEGDSAS